MGKYINYVEIQGKVGTVRIQPINGSKVASFSVVTQRLYTNSNNVSVAEATWHMVTAWQNGSLCLEGLEKGVFVNVKGYTRTSMYTSADGTEKTYTEIVASSLKILPENEEV